MSALENRVKPILEPMLTGERTGLDSASQAVIVLWALKTAMVLEGVEASALMRYTQLEREQLGRLSVVPTRTSVWLTALVDSQNLWSSKTEHSGGGADTGTMAHTTTLAFGSLAIQVLTLRISVNLPPETRVTTDTRRGPWDAATVRIWPPHEERASWPPQIGLQGEPGLQALAERFKTSGLGPDEVQPIVV
jgi:hypothetical protein